MSFLKFFAEKFKFNLISFDSTFEAFKNPKLSLLRFTKIIILSDLKDINAKAYLVRNIKMRL
jgi:hypothetical protein